MRQDMPDFPLVDLYSQREAVAQHVKGWDITRILEWMSQYGTVEKVSSSYDDRAYVFRSIHGEHTPFRVDENNNLVVFHLR